ncbi:MAG: hypothetical protein KUG81_06640 [Gammaproteobacteria bacterium]|nr:hypothetical protein [Gammaproteobacteria bacterium]
MITLKFPSLDKALLKNLKDAKEDDPRKGIIVINGNAIVLRDDFCFVINLYDYFTIEFEIEEEDEIEELKRILFYMNGKVFNAEFWKELTKGCSMKMNQGELYVSTPKYAKDLHHNPLPVDLLEPLNGLQEAYNYEENLVSAIAVPFQSLFLIYECLKGDFKFDNIIFQFSSQDRPVKFTFRNRKHCFGYIHPHYDAVQEGFRFTSYEEFIEDDEVKEMIVELKSAIVPPPPPLPTLHEQEEMKQQNNQLKIVTDDT